MFLRAPGVRVRPLGTGWVAYSALSRESHLLNDESVAVLDELDESTPRSAREIAERLSEPAGLPALELEAILGPAWGSLAEVGLIRILATPGQP
jgi:PqqD family protein of HPr-rel-A system